MPMNVNVLSVPKGIGPPPLFKAICLWDKPIKRENNVTRKNVTNSSGRYS